MFKSKTTFVIGAGCSKELNFPLGDELKGQIANLVNVYYERGFDLRSGDVNIVEAIRQHANRHGHNANDYYAQGRVIAGALPLAISIDNFLEAHRLNSYAVLCGKLGIVRAILLAEAHSKLAWKPHDSPLNFSPLGDTWLIQLSRYLTEGVALADIDSLFENVSFIIFNYDRCVEFFLWQALQRYYAMPAERVEAILRRARFYHPYGAVGSLPWQAQPQSGVPYGHSGVSGLGLVSLAQGIRTFSEEVEDDQRQEMVSELERSEVVVFLGFSFIQQNMKLLAPTGSVSARRILATALGMSRSDCDVVKEGLKDYLAGPGQIEIRNDLKAAQLFSEYSKSITQDFSAFD